MIPEYKAFLCDIAKLRGWRAGEALLVRHGCALHRLSRLPGGVQAVERAARREDRLLRQGRGYQNPADLGPKTWKLITYNEVVARGRKEWAFGTRQCMHCNHPACAAACPVGALEKLDNGPVVYHKERCIGCRYCMLACPFEVPRFDYDSPNPYISKCTLCADRIEAGGMPACAKACPTEALTLGQRDDLIAEAHRRIANNPSEYHHGIYGLEEAGGTCVLHLASVPFEKLGYPTGIPERRR